MLVAAAILLGPVLLPVLPLLGEHFLGIEFVDHYGTQWFYWFTERQLRAGESLGWTDLFFYPFGKDIYAHTGTNILDAIAAAPFRALLGPIAGYNAFVITAVALSGAAIFRLARLFTEDTTAAGVAAVLACASPFVLQELIEGRPTQAIVLLPALMLHAAWRTATTPGLITPLMGGVLLAGCGYQYWYYALFGGLITSAIALWRIGTGPDRLPVLGRYALMAAAALLLTMPAALPMLRQLHSGGEVAGLLDVRRWSMGSVSTLTVHGQEAGLFLWQPLRGTFGYYTLYEDGAGQLGERASGWTWLDAGLLLLGALAMGRHRRGAFLAATAAAVLIACGPIVMLGDHYIGNPLYIALAKALGVVQRLWWPGRAYAFVVLLVACAAAAVLGALSPRRRIAATAALVSASLWLLTGRSAVPFPTWDGTIPAAYRCLAAGPPGGVIHLPFHWTQGHIYYQTAHGRPMLGGMRDEQDMFVPAAWKDFRDSSAMVTALIAASDSPAPSLVWPAADQIALGAQGFRYLVLRLDSWEPEAANLPDLAVIGTRNQRRRLRQALTTRFGPPVYADARTEIYTPWGGPSPCASGQVPPDTEAVGAPDPSLATGLSEDTLLTDILPLL